MNHYILQNLWQTTRARTCTCFEADDELMTMAALTDAGCLMINYVLY